MSHVLAVDLDGTLFYPKRTKTLISSANLQFIRDFIDAGNRVIIVTSRNREFAELTAAKIDRPIDFVCINGAQIVVDGNVIHDETLTPGRAQEIFDGMKGHGKQPLAWFIDSKRFQNLMYSGETSWFTQLFFKYYYKSQGVYQQSYLADNDIFLSELKKGEIYRLLLYFGLGRRRVDIAKDVNKHVRERYGQDIEASWINTVVEIAPFNCTKAAALEKVIALKHIDRDQVYVVGDSGNDISMFQNFQAHSYAMEHAHDSVKKFARYTIKKVHHLRRILLDNEDTL